MSEKFVYLPVPQHLGGRFLKKWFRHHLRLKYTDPLPSNWNTTKGIFVPVERCTPEFVRECGYIVSVTPKTRAHPLRDKFLRYFGALLLAVLLTGSNLSQADASTSFRHATEQRFNPMTFGAVNIFRRPFKTPQWDDQREPIRYLSPDIRPLLLQWHLNGQRSSLVRSFEKEVGRYLGEIKATRDVRRAYGELFICTGLAWLLLAHHGRLKDRQDRSRLT